MHSIGLEGVALTRHKRHARRALLCTEAWMASFSWDRVSLDRDMYEKKSAVAMPELKRTAAGRGRSAQGRLRVLCVGLDEYEAGAERSDWQMSANKDVRKRQARKRVLTWMSESEGRCKHKAAQRDIEWY